MASDEVSTTTSAVSTSTPRSQDVDPETPLYTKGKSRTYGAIEGRGGTGIPTVCWYILIVELCERLAFYTLTGSQSFFLEHIGFKLSDAGALNATMWTLCLVLAVAASWVADVGVGRYYTIFGSGVLYVTGCGLASLAAIPGKENTHWYFFGVMGLLPMATAGIKANISNFGADQYDENDPEQVAAQERFFSVFYCSINVGALGAYGFFTTFASGGGLGVPKPWGYATAYGLMACCMAGAVAVFCAGHRRYKVHPLLERSSLASLLSNLRRAAVEGGSLEAASVLGGLVLLCASVALSAVQALLPALMSTTVATEEHGLSTSTRLMIVSFACAALGAVAFVVPCLNPNWLHTGRTAVTAEEQDVCSFLKLMPALFTGNVAFNALYNCMQFWYAQQACQMDVRLPLALGGFQLSGSFFNIADCVAIVSVTPLAVMWIDPTLSSMFRGRFNHGRKFAVGMCIAMLSVLMAARLEVLRRESPVLPLKSDCAPPGVGMSDMAGAWMFLPFFFMGVAEIYTQPTLLHYAYSKSPASMRTLAMAASFFISSVSSALFALLVSFMAPYMPNDLNNGHLEYGYYINVAIGCTFLVPFLAVLGDERAH